MTDTEELAWVLDGVRQSLDRIAESLEKLTPQLEWLRKHELFTARITPDEPPAAGGNP